MRIKELVDQNMSILIFTILGLGLSALRFFFFSNLNSVDFVSVNSILGIITVIAGFIGISFDQIAERTARGIMFRHVFIYQNVVFFSAIVLLIFSVVEDFSGLLLIPAFAMILGSTLLNRFFAIINYRNWVMQFCQWSYGFYVFLLVIVFMFPIYTYYFAVLICILSLIEIIIVRSLVTTSVICGPSDRNVSREVSFTNLKNHFLTYSGLFVILKIIEYGDKVYCNYFSCSKEVILFVKLGTLFFAASSIAFSSHFASAQKGEQVPKFYKYMGFLIYILLAGVILFFSRAELIIISNWFILVLLISLPIVFVEIRFFEWRWLNAKDIDFYHYLKLSVLAFLPVLLVFLSGYVYFGVYVFYLFRYILMKYF